MASVTAKTRKFTRDKLASFLGNQELIKAFENLTEDVGVTLPDAVNSNASAIDELSNDLGTPPTAGLEALLEAAIALAEAREASGMALQGQVAELIAQVAELRIQINDLRQGYVL